MSDKAIKTPAMNAASQRLIPDAECVQSKCGCTTTGCWGECSLKRNPVVFAMNAASPTTPDVKYMRSLARTLRNEDEMESAHYWAIGHESADYLDKLSDSFAAPVGQGSAPPTYDPAIAAVGCPDFSDDMLPPDMMRRNMRAQRQARCKHQYATSPGFGGAFCATCGMLEPAPTADTLELDQGSATSGEALTDAELADPVFVRAYIEGCNDSFNAAMVEVKKLRATLAAKAEQSNSIALADLGARNRVAEALGLGVSGRFSFAWSYLLGSIEEAVKVCDELSERAAAPASVPEGCKLVPMKLTEEMHVAAVRAIARSTGNDDFPPAVWSAMIAAAPEVAQPAYPQGESIDTPQFRKLVCDIIFGEHAADQMAATDALVTNINEWGAHQRHGGGK
jgi:hypothetical protein